MGRKVKSTKFLDVRMDRNICCIQKAMRFRQRGLASPPGPRQEQEPFEQHKVCSLIAIKSDLSCMCRLSRR